jgi:hypothetical protein
MRDPERRRAWRKRRKDGGLVRMTIWVQAETQAPYEALAQQSHRSGSELAQLALEAYQPDPAAITAAGTAPDQIRARICEDLAQALALITATVPVTGTETIKEALPAWV